MNILLSVLFSLRRTELAFKLAFPICVVINLLPQLLLEFRYFVIPFILQRLQLRPQSWWTLMAEMAMFQFVNIGKGNRNCFFFLPTDIAVFNFKNFAKCFCDHLVVRMRTTMAISNW